MKSQESYNAHTKDLTCDAHCVCRPTSSSELETHKYVKRQCLASDDRPKWDYCCQVFRVDDEVRERGRFGQMSLVVVSRLTKSVFEYGVERYHKTEPQRRSNREVIAEVTKKSNHIDRENAELKLQLRQQTLRNEELHGMLDMVIRHAEGHGIPGLASLLVKFTRNNELLMRSATYTQLSTSHAVKNQRVDAFDRMNVTADGARLHLAASGSDSSAGNQQPTNELTYGSPFRSHAHRPKRLDRFISPNRFGNGAGQQHLGMLGSGSEPGGQGAHDLSYGYGNQGQDSSQGTHTYHLHIQHLADGLQGGTTYRTFLTC
jgi:hypothetical protein